jgi:hypothetical protein
MKDSIVTIVAVGLLTFVGLFVTMTIVPETVNLVWSGSEVVPLKPALLYCAPFAVLASLAIAIGLAGEAACEWLRQFLAYLMRIDLTP